MDKESAYKESILRQSGARVGQAMGAVSDRDSEYPRENRPMTPEASGFDWELRKLVTRARWQLSDSAVLEIMGMVANELHQELSRANQE
jgi:hypothetical protein